MLHFASGNFLKFKPDFWSNGKRPCSTVSHSMCHVHNLHAKNFDFLFRKQHRPELPRYLQKLGLVLLNIAKAASILYGANSLWNSLWNASITFFLFSPWYFGKTLIYDFVSAKRPEIKSVQNFLLVNVHPYLEGKQRILVPRALSSFRLQQGRGHWLTLAKERKGRKDPSCFLFSPIRAWLG